MLRLALLLGAALGLAVPAARSQPSIPFFQETPPAAASEAEAPRKSRDPTLSEANREIVELIRSTLQEEGREIARELLAEAVAALAEPESGGEPSHIALLLELDRIAEELGSLEEARQLRESVLELRERLLLPDHPDLIDAKNDLGVTRVMLGDLAGARALQEEVLAAQTRLLPPDHPDLLGAKQNLAATLTELGDIAGGRELFEEVLAAHTRLLPPDHPELLGAKHNLAIARRKLGDLAGALELEEAVLAARTRLLPPDHPDLLAVKAGLATTRRQLGDVDGARELVEEVFAARTRLLPPDHPDLLNSKVGLAITREELGDLAGARELREEVLAARTRLLPPDHPDLLAAKHNLALTRKALGDLAGARELQEEVLAAHTRLLPPEHPDRLGAKQNLAITRWELGERAGAYELFEEVLATRTRLLPRDHPNLLAAKLNLAITRRQLGDLAGARELQEEVLAVRTRILPPDHPDLLSAKHNLAATRSALGDRAGARELAEEVLAARTRFLPADHPDLLSAKHNLAISREELGDLAGARALREEVLAARTRLLPPDHPDLLIAKHSLAITRRKLGDLAGARALAEEVLAARTRLLPPDHPDLLSAKLNLAITLRELGDLAGARDLVEEVLAAQTRLLPCDHPDLLSAKKNLAATRLALGDLAGARELFSSLLAGQRVRARGLLADSPRAAREGARVELQRLFEADVSSAIVAEDDPLAAELFATLESLREASVARSQAVHASNERPELAEQAHVVAALRSRTSDLVAAGPDGEEAAESWRSELLRLTEERDRAERELRVELEKAGAFVGEIDAQAIGARLSPGAVVASFLRYPKRSEKDPETGRTPPSVDSLLAFLVRPGGAVQRVELGPSAELEALVGDWRRALGKPIERGIAALAEGERSETEIGCALRARILDPLLVAAGEDVRELHVVLDDLLHLLPLDALPLAGELRVGERLQIHVEPTLARLLRERRPVAPGGTLVALGGIDFESALEEPSDKPSAGPEGEPEQAEPVPAALLLAAAPPLERSGRPEQFEPLRQTLYEVEDVAAQFREAFEGDSVLLEEGRATKAAFFACAPRARFLHMATHGWFAAEVFQSQLDTLAERGGNEGWLRAQETLTGFAPETLCGLALAGANRGRDALGRVPGILTAEELASFDLRQCELAVLSACETNVGIRRAGQGIQSLQTALHAAGARTAITSLWKVDDAATRRLFELFYTKLWKDDLGKAEALWQAKMALRAEGHPLRDWAGWVLSGDPE